MRIHGQGTVNGAQIISAYMKTEKATSKKETLTDTIELSDEAKEIAELQKLAAGLPEVREDLVLQLKQKIAANSYHVPAEKLAGKIYEEIVTNRK